MGVCVSMDETTPPASESKTEPTQMKSAASVTPGRDTAPAGAKQAAQEPEQLDSAVRTAPKQKKQKSTNVTYNFDGTTRSASSVTTDEHMTTISSIPETMRPPELQDQLSEDEGWYVKPRDSVLPERGDERRAGVLVPQLSVEVPVYDTPSIGPSKGGLSDIPVIPDLPEGTRRSSIPIHMSFDITVPANTPCSPVESGQGARRTVRKISDSGSGTPGGLAHRKQNLRPLLGAIRRKGSDLSDLGEDRPLDESELNVLRLPPAGSDGYNSAYSNTTSNQTIVVQEDQIRRVSSGGTSEILSSPPRERQESHHSVYSQTRSISSERGSPMSAPTPPDSNSGVTSVTLGEDGRDRKHSETVTVAESSESREKRENKRLKFVGFARASRLPFCVGDAVEALDDYGQWTDGTITQVAGSAGSAVEMLVVRFATGIVVTRGANEGAVRMKTGEKRMTLDSYA